MKTSSTSYFDYISDDDCRGQEVSTSADSGEVFSLINRWCKDCLHEHEICVETSAKESWLPDRVIDVGPQDGGVDPYLFVSRAQGGKYIALTHRWNPKDTSGTTSLNFDARTTRIPMTELSSTFRDAIYLTRKLNVRFLWIDAICIIQDSIDDWKRQSSNMMSIYELSWLNVCITGSEVELGCFLTRTPRLSRRCRLPSTVSSLLAALTSHPSENKQTVYAHLGSDFYARSIYNGYISRRGWIFQERILSPRTVYFGREEIYWECSKMAASESIPWGFNSDHSWPLAKMKARLVPPAASLLDHSAVNRSLKSFQQETYTYWYKLVESYSCLTLTKQTDALAAVLGLAQALHKSHEGGTFVNDYVDGLWMRDIQRGLLWYPASNAEYDTPTLPSHFPSYSWASHKGPVMFLEEEKQYLTVYFDLQVGELVVQDDLRTSTRSMLRDPQSRHGLQIFGFLHLGALKLNQYVQDVPRSGTVIDDSKQEMCSAMLDRNPACDQMVKSWLEGNQGLVYCFHLVIANTESRLTESMDAKEQQNFLEKRGNLDSGMALSVDTSLTGLLSIPLSNTMDVFESLTSNTMSSVDRSPADFGELYFKRIGLVTRKSYSQVEVLNSRKKLVSIVIL